MIFPFDKNAFAEQTAELDRWREQLDAAAPLQARSWTGLLRRDLEAEAVAASTQLEGVAVTVEEVRRILAGDPPAEVTPGDQALVEGYRDAMGFVRRRADDAGFRWSRELITGLHDRVLAGDGEAGAGRLRDAPTAVVSAATREVVFRPPESGIPAHVDRLCATTTRLLSPGGKESVHPALAAAWLHVAFAAVHPFRDGNGRTARVLASLVMYRGGFRSVFFTSLEEWWGHHPSDYYEAFGCLGDSFDPKAEITGFIAAHLGAQLSQVRALDLRERTQQRLWTLLENLVGGLGLPERAAFAVWEAFFGREITAAYYRGMTDVSPATARNDLSALIAAGFFSPAGQTRARRNRPTNKAVEVAADELGLRERPATTDDLRRNVIAAIASRGAAGELPDHSFNRIID
jgi:Fic family protein